MKEERHVTGQSSDQKSATLLVFKRKLDENSQSLNSKIILALDLDHRDDTRNLLRDARNIVELTADHVCAVKINFHLILPLSLSELTELNKFIVTKGLLSIADLKLNDIGNTNRVATEYLWDAGFSAVIVNPFVGFLDGLDVVFKRARELGKGVITLGYMSHKGADEGYGLELSDQRTMFDVFLEKAKSWKSDGVIVGTTRANKIKRARQVLGRQTGIFCPGSGAQGGDQLAALKAGADYLIFGRTIVASPDPRAAARQIKRSLQFASKARS